MKKLASIAAFTICMLSMSAQSDLTGIWNTGTDNSKIEISETDGSLVGKLISSDNENAQIGKTLVKELEADGDHWKGKLYAPKRGEWYDATFEAGGDKLEITIGSGFMSRTVEWTKE